MKSRVLSAVLLMLQALISSLAQTPGPKPSASNTPSSQSQEKTTGEDDVVRITANLVQIDAVVTDSRGRQVTDLSDNDFEIFEDGRAQKITHLSYVSIKPSSVEPPPPVVGAAKDKAATPPVNLRPERVRRTIALVVDDLRMSFESTVYIRQALKRFVDDQMQPGDLVAIIRTRAGTGPLQQFTGDKRLLYAAIDRIRWNPSGVGLVGAFAPIDLDSLNRLEARAAASIRGGTPSLSAPTESGTGRLEQFRKEVFSVGTLGALKFVVQGMRPMPGRKSVIVMSDGISILGSSDTQREWDWGATRVLDALRDLTDSANRASVVIYTMDSRGLQTLGLNARDNTNDLTDTQVVAGLANRRKEFVNSQDGLNYLAQQTGGFLIHDTNDLAGGIAKVLDDQTGYYLIGYRPDDSTFNVDGQRSFHELTVRVKRSGLKVRARTGFYSITDEAIRVVPQNSEQLMLQALLSPFSSTDVHLRLTSLFGSDANNQPVIRALFHIDGYDLTFIDAPDGWHQLSFEVLAVTFGESGTVADKFGRIETMRVRDDAYRLAQQQGLIYTLNVPLHGVGAYQLRVAVRDTISNRVGAASQFIEVPNLKKGQLALSGIVVAGLDPVTPSSAHKSSISTSESAGQPEGLNSELEAQASPAVRRMRPGMMLNYAYSIYNAARDKRTHRPQLQTQIRLFRGTQLVYTGKVVSLEVNQQNNLKPIFAVGTLQLEANERAGDYFLEVIVTDLLADKKRNTTVSWIDFEILN